MSVATGDIVLDLSIAESRVPVDIDDSLVPQLTANMPIPIAVSNNFFIQFYFGVYYEKTTIIPNMGYKVVKYR
ncbi:hypothetical protein CIN01S_06_00060 [Chryseobacterium indologenes NBRC 14944]|nr:hypothetical protein CIN01S_06_00060 [Chryseobacterium indologenes NBRC 14944]